MKYNSNSFLDTFLPSKRNSEQSICKDILRNLGQSSPENGWLCFENVISGESFTSDRMMNDIKRWMNSYCFSKK